MNIDISANADSVRSAMSNAQTSRLLKQGRAAASGGPPGSNEEATIEKAGKDFESILLGSWLQKAEQSFATLPGGDEDQGGDPGKDQFQGMAMQSLASSLTASGGIGIAKMITEHLRTATQDEQPAASKNLQK